MNFKKADMLNITNNGLNIYAHILRQYYPNETVIQLSGRKSKLTRNPFLDNSETLELYNPDDQFFYKDISKAIFTGNPFHFASRHYQLEGQPLLAKINEELNLNLDKSKNVYLRRTTENKKELNTQKSVTQMPVFSFFKHPVSNTIPAKTINIKQVYQLIQSQTYEKITNTLRNFTNPKDAKYFKANHYDYVTFSGTFTKRNNNDLITHSGLITIDFDHVLEIEKVKQKLLIDEYFDTELLFISPSGDGLKWIISIDVENFTHQDNFIAIKNYINQTYKLNIDKSGCDVSRACFLPYDKSIFINPKHL